MALLLRRDPAPRGKDPEGGLGPPEDRQRRRRAPAAHPSRRTSQGGQHPSTKPGGEWRSGGGVQEQRPHQEDL